jgi:hypothetical protein
MATLLSANMAKILKSTGVLEAKLEIGAAFHREM